MPNYIWKPCRCPGSRLALRAPSTNQIYGWQCRICHRSWPSNPKHPQVFLAAMAVSPSAVVATPASKPHPNQPPTPTNPFKPDAALLAVAAAIRAEARSAPIYKYRGPLTSHQPRSPSR